MTQGITSPSRLRAVVGGMRKMARDDSCHPSLAILKLLNSNAISAWSTNVCLFIVLDRCPMEQNVVIDFFLKAFSIQNHNNHPSTHPLILLST